MRAIYRKVFSGLRWLGQGRTGSAAVAQTVLARAFMLVGSLATGVIVARTLAPIGRGEQAAIYIWPVLASSVFTLGLPLSLIYNMRRYPAEDRSFFSVALPSTFVLGIIAAIFGACIIPIALHKYPTNIIRTAQLLIVFAIQPLVQYVSQAALEARGRFSTSNVLRYGPLIITLIALSALAALHRLTPVSAVLCYAVPPTFLTMTTLWQLRDMFPLDFTGWRTVGKRLYAYGFKTCGNDVINSFAAQIEQGLLVGLLAPAALGVYTVGLSVSRTLNVFHSAFVIVLLPKAAGKEIEEVVSLTTRSMRVSTAISSVAAIGLAVLAPLLLPLLYGHAFADAIPVSRLLFIEVIFGGAVAVLSQTFMALGRPATTTIFQAAGLATSGPFLLLFIPRFGLTGAALAFVCSTGTRLILALLSYPILLKRPIPSLIITKDDVAFVRQRIAARRTPTIVDDPLLHTAEMI